MGEGVVVEGCAYKIQHVYTAKQAMRQLFNKQSSTEREYNIATSLKTQGVRKHEQVETVTT